MRTNSLRKGSIGQTVAFAIAFIVLFAVALSYIAAFVWGFLLGMKSHDELIMQPFALPQKWLVKNYAEAFTMLVVRKNNMIDMIINSLWLSIGGAFIAVLGNTLMAYAVTKYKFWGRGALVTINVIIMTLPIVGSLPSQFRMYTALKIIDSPFFLVTYIGGFGSINLIMCASFRNLSWTYAEAAIVDGAGHHRVLWSIMMPLVRGPFFAMFVIMVVSIWNDYMSALLFLPNMPTLATGLYLFQTNMVYNARMDILMAATMLSAIPPLLLYILFNKTILTSVSLGGIKG